MYKFIFIGLTIFSTIAYFVYSQNKISSLTKEKAELSVSLTSYIEANNMLRSSINIQLDKLEETRIANRKLEEKASKALEALENSDLNYLSQKKPELIEKIINEGTRNVFKEIESITAN